MKLKPLLEGYAWERRPGKGLPTLAEVESQHRKILTEDETDFLSSIDALSTACKEAQTALSSAVGNLDFGTSKDADEAKEALTQNVNTVMNALCTYVDGIKTYATDTPDDTLYYKVINNITAIFKEDQDGGKLDFNY